MQGTSATSTLPATFSSIDYDGLVHDAYFTLELIPEPSALALLAIGLVALRIVRKQFV